MTCSRYKTAVGFLVALAASGSASASGLAVSAKAGEARAGERAVLNESAYCRAYHQFGWDRIDSRTLRQRGKDILGEQGMKRLERQVKALLAGRKIDWSKQDWRDHAVERDITISHSREGDIGRLAASQTPPPPADWLAPDFDDAAWPRFIKPFAVGPNASLYFSQWSMLSPGLQAGFFRFRFQVPDPARAGRLALEAEYVGGIRVFLNGREIARGHLPTGSIAPETPAEGYGKEAYLRLFTELPEKYRQRYLRQHPQGKPPQYLGFANWDAPRGSRVYKARNRTLGPVAIPAGALRAGTNVLAVEIRSAGLHPIALGRSAYKGGGGMTNVWLHGALSTLVLRARTGDVPSAVERPKGVQVWAEDMHRRVYNCEYLTPGESPGRIRLVGARNGTYSAQVVVGADRDLTDVQVVPTDLRGEGGRTIPASAVRVCGMQGHPVANITELGGGRIPTGESFYTGRASCFPEFVARERFMPQVAGAAARAAAWKKVHYFDHITRAVPRAVPAGTCRPYWLSVRVPPDAAPGRYTGAVRVRAGGAGAVEVPLRLDVADWLLPDAVDLQTIAAVEQSPYGVARHYQVALWSQEHWKLIEKSLAQLARIGNDWWFVPVILRTEFGNADDSMIRWVRGGDGSLRFDFAVLDTYLDLIVRHCGSPRVISFVVMHGSPAAVDVNVLNDATGRTERLRLGGKGFDPAVRASAWRSFAGALYAHMKARGLAEAMHWGYAWDTEGDPLLKPLLKACVPDVYWTFGAHSQHARGSGGSMHTSSLKYYKSIVLIYGLKPGLTSRRGWKRATPHLLNPRVLSSCHTTEGHSPPFSYRLLVDRALVAGHNGIGRIGGDYWGGAYFHRCVAGSYHLAGFSIRKVLWGGPDGAEPSQRFEAILEGMQETEVRIFLEQALDRKLLPEPLAGRVQGVLDRHNRETLYIPVHVAANLNTEGTPHWQRRSGELYQAAAEAARAVGLDADTDSFGIADSRKRPWSFGAVILPALGEKHLTIRLRNWTGRARKWTAKADVPWIRLAESRGTVTGQEPLAVKLDGAGLRAGQTVTGTVTITDVASGGVRPVAITAQVGKAVEVSIESTIFNVPPGASQAKELTLLNHTAKPCDWTLKPSAPWLKVAPPAGRLPPNGAASVRVTASAPGPQAGFHQARLALAAADGQVTDSLPLQVFTIPRYSPPRSLPAGRKVPLTAVHKSIVVSHRSWSPWRAALVRSATFAKSLSFWHTDRPVRIGSKTYEMALWALPYHETVYKLEGSGIRAFSAEVGVNSVVAAGGTYGAGHENIRVCFEVHVDGRIVAHSGLMRSTDGPRLLVAENLDKAKRLKLVTRLSTMLYGDRSYRGQFAFSNWADPAVYKEPQSARANKSPRPGSQKRRVPKGRQRIAGGEQSEPPEPGQPDKTSPEGTTENSRG